MSDDKQVERFDIPTKDKTPLEIWQELKEFFGKVAAERGEELGPEWDKNDTRFADRQKGEA